MAETFENASSISLDVTNIGGISETSVEIDPGITTLVGRNATNRTSLMQAIAGALGTDVVSLKGDASRGEVTLRFGDETYTRRLRRENGTVRTDGEPYLEEPDLAELYAVLLESNEIRRAVRGDGDLRDLLLQPVDTEAISERIADTVERRRNLDAELDRLEDLENTLENLEAERCSHEARLEAIEDDIADKRQELSELDEGSGDDPGGTRTELEGKREALREARTDLEEIQQELEIERKSLDSLRENRRTLETELDSVAAPEPDRLTEIEERIEELRDRKRTLASVVGELQGVIRFNEERLDEAELGSAFLDSLEDSDSEITGELDPEERTTTCWTCGSEVRRANIREMIEELQEIRTEKSAERNRIESQIAELSEEREKLEAAREQREHLESRLEDVLEKIETREGRIEDLTERRDSLAERVDDLESDIEQLREAQQDDLLAVQAEVSELEVERDRIRERLDGIQSDIEEVRTELAAREHLQARREELSEELRDLRTRIDRKEREAVEAFNTHMDAIIDRLGYDNIERIWIEPTRTDADDESGGATEEVFDIHVVREDPDGATYQDSLDHLSESERELVGLVLALAGYLVHDVHESVPFMLLDSLEMMDGERIVALAEYLADYVPYLLVVILPDHADAFDTAGAPPHHRISDI